MKPVAGSRVGVCWVGVCLGLAMLMIATPSTGEDSAGEGSGGENVSLVSARLGEVLDWSLMTDRDGIRVYAASSRQLRLRAFRGETDMHIDDFRALAPQLDDYASVASWMHMVSEISELGRREDHDRDLHLATYLPWPVRNRDAVLRVSLQQDPADYTLTVTYDDTDSGWPSQPGYLRMPTMAGQLQFRPLAPPKVAVSFEVIADPGGAIPAWLGNMMMRDIPYFSLYRLKRVVNQTTGPLDYHPAVVAPPGWPAAGALAGPQP